MAFTAETLLRMSLLVTGALSIISSTLCYVDSRRAMAKIFGIGVRPGQMYFPSRACRPEDRSCVAET